MAREVIVKERYQVCLNDKVFEFEGRDALGRAIEKAAEFGLDWFPDAGIEVVPDTRIYDMEVDTPIRVIGDNRDGEV